MIYIAFHHFVFN